MVVMFVAVDVVQQVIASGVENLDSGIGVYAGDEDVYTVFGLLMDRVIEDYHRFPPNGVHVSDMDSSKLRGKMDPTGEYVISTRIRVGRNIRGFGLSPGIKREDRATVERLVSTA
jgi:hypothetical protein